MSAGERPAPVTAALEEVFAVTAAGTREQGWRPASELLAPDSADLAERIAAVRAQRPGATDAVAGSLLVQGYARLLGWPAVGARLRDDARLDTGPGDVALLPGAPGLGRLGFRSGPVPAGPQDPDPVAPMVGGHLAPLVEAVHLRTRVGRRTLWSNVAAALAGAYLALSWTMPDRAHYLGPARTALGGPLQGLVGLTTAEQGGQRWMVAWRKGCCLAFRTQQSPAYCGTCPILDEAERLRHFRRAAARHAAPADETGDPT